MNSDAEEFPTQTLVDEHLPGYAEVYDQLKNKVQETDDVALALEFEGRAGDFGLQAARGIATPFKAMLDFLRGRKHVRDLGVHPVEVPWLEFHVPRSCSGALKWKTSGSEEAAFSLNVLGSGLGSGRRIAWSVESDIPARANCMKFIQKLNVQVNLYQLPDGERYETSVDVVAAQGRQLVAWRDCPYCSRTLESVDDFEFQKGQMIDLRAYDSKYVETFTHDLTQPLNASLGITLPALPAIPLGTSLGISFKREARLSCNLVYEFAMGHCYQPYWPTGCSASFPYWSCT